MEPRTVLAGALASLLIAACNGSAPGTTGAATEGATTVPAPAATPCGGIQTWPPIGPIGAPTGLGVSPVAGLTVRLANATAQTWYFHVSEWFDGECTGWMSAAPGAFGSIAAGTTTEATATAAGTGAPHHIGVELWDHPCDASCTDAPAGVLWADVSADAPSAPPSAAAGAPEPAATAATSAGPSTGTRVYEDVFAIAGAMLHPGTSAHALVLQDGRVLVLSAFDVATSSATPPELFDPATDAFSAIGGTAVTPNARGIVLRDGLVLAIGGSEQSTSNIPVATVEILDPETGEIRQVAPMAEARLVPTSVLLGDGRVLVIGGWTANGLSTTAELFDPGTGTFHALPMVTPRAPGAVVTLQDGRVLVLGGFDAAREVVATAELFDPKTSAFAETGPMVTPRAPIAATVLAGGRVLVGAGSGPGYAEVMQPELFDPATGTFSATGPMVEPRFAGAVALHDGRALVLGGAGPSLSEVTTAELFDPRTGSFRPAGPMVVPRVSQSTVLLHDGRVLIFGGNDPSGPALTTPEVFDPATDSFGAVPPMAVSRTSETHVLLPDGRVLVLSGLDDTGRPVSVAELFH